MVKSCTCPKAMRGDARRARHKNRWSRRTGTAIREFKKLDFNMSRSGLLTFDSQDKVKGAR
jgi:hypothetical protein